MDKQIHLLFLSLLLFVVMGNLFGQSQIGGDIDGEWHTDRSGDGVSISANGTRVAIGAIDNSNGINTNSGHVRIYEESGGNWTQLGNDIDGEASHDFSGDAVSMSANGTRVAIGAMFNDGNGQDAGHVRVYEESGGTWTKLGNDIDGESTGDQSGSDVSLSSDGKRLAVGAKFNDGIGTDAGHVRVYEESGGSWTQLGNDIDGESSGDQSGFSVSLSSDGKRLAIGAPYNDSNGFIDLGHVRVYEESGGNWTQVGIDIDGEPNQGTSGSGWSVSLSSNGKRLAIGTPWNDDNGFNAGQVRLFEESGGTWAQIGGDIEGQGIGHQLGRSLSLSDDGLTLAIGAFRSDNNGVESGHVEIYEDNGGVWNKVGSDINGEAAQDRSGSSVSISSTVTRVAIGAPYNDGNGSNSGHTRIYDFTVLPIELISFRGKSSQNSIQLNWQTASESNNKGFEIQWLNGEWIPIGYISGHGSSSIIQNYSFNHLSPNLGNNFYRLKQEDFDGSFSYSDIISVLFNEVSLLNLYPNPANSTINFRISKRLENISSLIIQNMLGQTVLKSTPNALPYSIDVSDFEPGFYWLQLLNGNAQVSVQCFQKI